MVSSFVFVVSLMFPAYLVFCFVESALTGMPSYFWPPSLQAYILCCPPQMVNLT